MIDFQRKDSDESTYNLTAQITSYGAYCLRQLFNIQMKHAVLSKLVKTNQDAKKLLGVACNWFSVTEECHNKINVLDIQIPKEDMETTLSFLESDKLENYCNSIEPLTLDFKRFILNLRDSLVSAQAS